VRTNNEIMFFETKHSSFGPGTEFERYIVVLLLFILCVLYIFIFLGLTCSKPME
jgi:hypothetical protein